MVCYCLFNIATWKLNLFCFGIQIFIHSRAGYVLYFLQIFGTLINILLILLIFYTDFLRFYTQFFYLLSTSWLDGGLFYKLLTLLNIQTIMDAGKIKDQVLKKTIIYCNRCLRVFKSKRGLSTHQSKCLKMEKGGSFFRIDGSINNKISNKINDPSEKVLPLSQPLILNVPLVQEKELSAENIVATESNINEEFFITNNQEIMLY